MSETTKYGLLIDYEYCSGCQSCVVACQEEHDFPVGKWGIRVFDEGPWQLDDSDDSGNCFNWNKIAIPTDLCDLCHNRVLHGKEPSCVHHCLAAVMTFGTLKELTTKLADKPKQVLWYPKQ